VRHSGLSFAIAMLAITAGCSARDDSVGPKPPPQLRRDASLDCEGTAEECAQIQRGIDYLKNHANPLCNMYGNSAQNRFDAPSGEGFRNSPSGPESEGFDMGVGLYPLPANPYTEVYPSFWTSNSDDAHTGALIAHEEYHHNGGGETQAREVQAQCLNPQP
jgi:hypothetical protein